MICAPSAPQHQTVGAPAAHEATNDNARVIPQNVQDRLLPEMRKLLGLEETIPEYTEVRALSPEQIKQLTPWEKDVLGIGIY